MYVFQIVEYQLSFNFFKLSVFSRIYTIPFHLLHSNRAYKTEVDLNSKVLCTCAPIHNGVMPVANKIKAGL